MRVVFVCLGNICRSPTAEGVFAALAPTCEVDSAGTGAWHVGEPPYGPMQAAARARGYELSTLRARQFVADDFAKFDLIVAMDSDNLANIERLRPAGNETPAKLFTDYATERPATQISAVPDPYYTRDFDGTLALIEHCAEGLYARLKAEGSL